MTANPVHIGRILEHASDWYWFRIDRAVSLSLPAEALRSGDVIRVRPVNEDYPFRTGECRVLGTFDDVVHVERPVWHDIAAIADMDHVYLTERPQRTDVESTRSIDAALDLYEAQRRFDCEYPCMHIAVGAHVRWWPDVTALGTPAPHARYIDGVVTKFEPLCIRVTGSHGFTERVPGGWRMPAIGGVVDTSISPGLVRRRPYAPGEKMTDRHPDSVIAQVVEDTIAKQVEHLATPIKVRSPYAPLPPVGEPAFRLFEHEGALFVDTSAGPVKITSDLAELRKSAPAASGKQWVTPVKLDNEIMAAVEGDTGCFDPRPTRPDGFDQHQVDAAKAALLAPAPPRYPRAGGRR